MTPHVHHRYAARQRRAANAIEANPHRLIINTLVEQLPSNQDPPATDESAALYTGHHLGIMVTDKLLAAPHRRAAEMIRSQEPSIMASCHATLATSIWTYFSQPTEYHLDFLTDLEKLARRITWTGSPYIPATRWELPDGSAIVTYGSQSCLAVHRDRIPLIRDDYMEVARQSIRRVTARGRFTGNHRGAIPLVPHPAFAPANDGILSHQAALPLDFDRCWCRYKHRNPDDPNHVRP